MITYSYQSWCGVIMTILYVVLLLDITLSFRQDWPSNLHSRFGSRHFFLASDESLAFVISAGNLSCWLQEAKPAGTVSFAVESCATTFSLLRICQHNRPLSIIMNINYYSVAYCCLSSPIMKDYQSLVTVINHHQHRLTIRNRDLPSIAIIK